MTPAQQDTLARIISAIGEQDFVATAAHAVRRMMGFDLTVHTQVHYTLTDTQTSKPVFDREVNADFTATVSDAFMAVERLRLANEGSIKKNIQTFLDQLIAEFGGAPKVSMTVQPAPGG